MLLVMLGEPFYDFIREFKNKFFSLLDNVHRFYDISTVRAPSDFVCLLQMSRISQLTAT